MLQEQIKRRKGGFWGYAYDETSDIQFHSFSRFDWCFRWYLIILCVKLFFYEYSYCFILIYDFHAGVGVRRKLLIRKFSQDENCILQKSLNWCSRFNILTCRKSCSTLTNFLLNTIINLYGNFAEVLKRALDKFHTSIKRQSYKTNKIAS